MSRPRPVIRRAKVAIPKKAKRQGRGGIVLIGTIIAHNGTVKDMSIAMTNAEQAPAPDERVTETFCGA